MKAGQDEGGARGAILESTIALLRVRGFDGFSVRDIAARAGVNVALINYYYSSKDGLLDAAIDVLLGELGRELASRLPEAAASRTSPVSPEGGGGPEALRSFANAYVGFLAANGGILRAVFLRILSGKGAPEPLARFIRTQGLEGLGALIHGGRASAAPDTGAPNLGSIQFVSALILPSLAGESMRALCGIDFSDPAVVSGYVDALVDRYSKG